ncbi:MAG: hypothetical protein ACRBFS_12620 [Aureispira sp.]
MREELLDDGISIEEEGYVYLQELQKYPPILQKLVLAIGGYVLLDILFMLGQFFLGSYFFIIGTVFSLLIDGCLIFLMNALWQQKKEQEGAHKQNFEQNEAMFLEYTYKTWSLLGFVFLIIIFRTVFFTWFYF